MGSHCAALDGLEFTTVEQADPRIKRDLPVSTMGSKDMHHHAQLPDTFKDLFLMFVYVYVLVCMLECAFAYKCS